MNAELRETLRDLVHASARCLDDQRFDDYLALYTPAGEYRLQVSAPELDTAMVWMAMNREELRARLASAASHEWQIYASVALDRLVAVDSLSINADIATTSATLAAYATDDDGRSRLYAVGRYDDRWEQQAGQWQLAQRIVHLRTRLLDTPTPLPL